ncbi:enoyl-CoA hydratase/isomerase family protein [Tomitella gaofuii]|uniref:enoyl-CoA hydratase/isomerase family protein n=1 Tax=Tomitella gaofuii TaxID=2760083 RepID=UPI0015FA86B0|nr:enoyl-CoA hydratase/isomerase family protein [Tomitella gaofuii]
MHAAVTLIIEQDLARITIDNSQRANSLTQPMLGELREHIATVAGSPGVRAVIVTGAGENFCAGLDITGIRAGDPHSIEHEYVAVVKALAECPKPTVAAIRGNCIGGGTQLAVACDLRIAADTAKFAITPAKLGLVYPPDSIERLTGVVGPAAAKRLLFTTDPITASTALHYG